MRELGAEEGGVERRVEEGGRAGDPPDRPEELLGLVEEPLPLGARGLADLGGEVQVPEVLDERGTERGVVVEELRDADSRAGEGGADLPPALLRRG